MVAPSIPKMQILLIEDSPLLRRLLTETLDEIEGVHVCGFAETEDEALEQLEVKSIDLAIVDIELAQGSGVGVLRALKKYPERYGLPNKVVFTNYAHSAMRQRCQELDIDAFFDKSLQMNDLVAYIYNKLPGPKPS